MSEEKQNFTGQQYNRVEIRSTWYSYWVTKLTYGFISALITPLQKRLAGVLLGGVAGGIVGGVAGGIVGGVAGLAVGGAIGWWVSWLFDDGPFYGMADSLRDKVNLQEYACRWKALYALYRKLLEEEWAMVPDRAISRWRPKDGPEPTQASLSRTEITEEEKPRLTESVTEEAEVALQAKAN
jgi:hypothetical protein